MRTFLAAVIIIATVAAAFGSLYIPVAHDLIVSHARAADAIR